MLQDGVLQTFDTMLKLALSLDLDLFSHPIGLEDEVVTVASSCLY